MKNNSSKIKDQKFDFKRIEDSLILILKANANPTWYLVGPPALTAFHGFIQALLLTLVNEDINETKNIIAKYAEV